MESIRDAFNQEVENINLKIRNHLERRKDDLIELNKEYHKHKEVIDNIDCDNLINYKYHIYSFHISDIINNAISKYNENNDETVELEWRNNNGDFILKIDNSIFIKYDISNDGVIKLKSYIDDNQYEFRIEDIILGLSFEEISEDKNKKIKDEILELYDVYPIIESLMRY